MRGRNSAPTSPRLTMGQRMRRRNASAASIVHLMAHCVFFTFCRFSLLLLDLEEYFFEQHLAHHITKSGDAIERSVSGSLKVCSKSLIFEPDKIEEPILKIALRDCSRIEVEDGDHLFRNNKHKRFSVVFSQVNLIKEQNIVTPYNLQRGKHRITKRRAALSNPIFTLVTIVNVKKTKHYILTFRCLSRPSPSASRTD
ncbi:unnamed protein product [Ranitomeya imitator]|uniref:FAN-like N-terminal PH domain-containing protein n=1 Tax=Ranitomeya imitator TaxID=111125 RepID=A0ABN9M159_9NEOB|nr:unnamed protein product [Ranitomeya imitator]